jgi:hypothetical protein
VATARTQRRLAGFRFDVQAPPLDEALPRMDVAAFVGFAASGPLDVPVAVESAAQFAAVFGDDAPLAYDRRRGAAARAALAPRLARWRALEPAERKAKAHAFLRQRGFSYDAIEEVLVSLDADDE